MLQKNTSGAPIILPTLDPPVTIPPGETFEFDQPLAGFTDADKPKDGTADKKAQSKAGGDKE